MTFFLALRGLGDVFPDYLNATFFWALLSQPDPYYVFPVLCGVSMFVSLEVYFMPCVCVCVCVRMCMCVCVYV